MISCTEYKKKIGLMTGSFKILINFCHVKVKDIMHQCQQFFSFIVDKFLIDTC